MKVTKLILSTVATLAIIGLAATPAFAKDKKNDASASASASAEKEKTITGQGKCAKCSLHESDKCQNVIESENKKGKKVTYYIADNDVAKEFHKNICKEEKKVTATGTVKKVDGKMQLTATKIEEAK